MPGFIPTFSLSAVLFHVQPAHVLPVMQTRVSGCIDGIHSTSGLQVLRSHPLLCLDGAISTCGS